MDPVYPSNPISILSQLSLDPISPPSTKKNRAPASEATYDTNDAAVALSQFILEVCNRQLRQYHLSTLEEETVNLNIGQGLDYSVDVSKTDEGELVAVKHFKIRLDTLSNDVAVQSKENAQRVWKALQEIQIMSHPPIDQCPNVLSVRGYGWQFVGGKTTTPSLVVELAEHGTLRQYLQNEPQKSDAEKSSLLSGMIEGLISIHNSGIVHGDIKMENILVCATENSQAVPKIADFGSSILLFSGQEKYEYGGTDIYNPPEVGASLGGPFISALELFQCDVWALGLLSLEVALDGKIYSNEETSRCLAHPRMEGFQASCLARLNDARFESTAAKTDYVGLIEATIQTSATDRSTVNDLRKSVLKKDVPETVKDILFIPEYTGEMSIIDMTDGLTLRGILKGRGTATFAPEKIPWSVQVEIVRRYEQLCKVDDMFLSGSAYLNLAICYYLGFGLERDQVKVGEYLDISARKGIPEALVIIHPLSELLGFELQLDHLDLDNDPYNDEMCKIIQAARNQKPYRPPFNELLVQQSKALQALGLRSESLHSAVLLNDFEEASKFLADGAFDSQIESGKTALLLACQNGNFRITKLLVESGSDPSIADDNGYTPLHMLCMFPDEDIPLLCQLLATKKGNVNIDAFSMIPYPLPDFWDSFVGSPLQWAVASGNLIAVEALLGLGARPLHAQGGLTPVQLAGSLFLYDILDVLIQQSDSSNLKPESHGLFFLNEAHPFRQIMIHGKDLPTAIQKTVHLLAPNHNVNISTSWGTTPLMKIALTNISSLDVLIVRELLQHCDTTVEGPQFSTIQAGIMGCAESPSKSITEITSMLIDAGFSARATCGNGAWAGWNSMHCAAAGRSLEIIETLFHKDPELLNIQTTSETKHYPLHIAARASYGQEMVKLLLKLGADPCATAGYGQTALMDCIGEKRLQIDMEKFESLLKANSANGYVVLASGSTILHIAALRAAQLNQENLPGYEFLQLLLQRPEIKALVNKKDGEGYTPLHSVCLRPDYSSIRLLVEAGADLHCKTPEPNSMSPLTLVLEIASHPGQGWAGKSLEQSWYKFALRAACYLYDCSEGTPHDSKLTRLHIAAYCSDIDEVKRLVTIENADVSAKNGLGQTPLGMLAGLLIRYRQMQRPLDPGYLQRAGEIVGYLGNSINAPGAIGGSAT